MKSLKQNNLYVRSDAYKALNRQLEESPPAFKYDIEGFYFFLDILYRWRVIVRDSSLHEKEYVTISSIELKYYLGHHTYKLYIKYLMKYGFVKSNGTYSYKNGISIGYKHTDKFYGQFKTIKLKSKGKIAININHKKKLKNSIPKDAFEKKLRKCYEAISYNHEGALKYLKELFERGGMTTNEYATSLISVNRLKDKDFTFSRNKTNNRLDTNLTNLKSELRNFIIGDFVQIDLRNSQPYLLNYLIGYSRYQVSNTPPYCGADFSKKEVSSHVSPLFAGLKNLPIISDSEYEKYNLATRSGRIYELFVTEFNIPRKQAKELFLTTLYSDLSHTRYSKGIKVFKETFPEIFNLIKRLKARDYKTFAIVMQKLEAEIYIDNIGKRIAEVGIEVYTVHDSVIIRAKKKKLVEKIIKQTFLEYFSEIPTFETTLISPDIINIEKELLTVKLKKRKKPKTVKDYIDLISESELIAIKSKPPKLSEKEQEEYDKYLSDFLEHHKILINQLV